MRQLTDIFLGDAVRVIARRLGFEVTMRMTQYTYDCLTASTPAYAGNGDRNAGGYDHLLPGNWRPGRSAVRS